MKKNEKITSLIITVSIFLYYFVVFSILPIKTETHNVTIVKIYKNNNAIKIAFKNEKNLIVKNIKNNIFDKIDTYDTISISILKYNSFGKKFEKTQINMD